MTRRLLQTRISIDQVRCLEEGDGFGSAEPYLWLVFFKIDGDQVVIGPDTFAHGECEVTATDGSHGNLGSDDVDAGDILNVSAAIGEFRTSLRPIPLAPELLGEPQAGQIGVIVALLEEDQVSDAGARAGYAALTAFAKQAIDEKVNQLNINKKDITEGEINELIDAGLAAVEDAIKNDSSEDIWSLVDKDDSIGVKVLRFDHDALTNNYWDISELFQSLVPNSNTVDEAWRILGEAQGVEYDTRQFTHHRRSADLATPTAAGAPTVTFHPFSGVQTTIYRDTAGRLHELWRDGNGQIGTTDLTAIAGAPLARGNPFGYLDTSQDQQIVVYRGDGDGIHSLYWTTGAVGLDNLSLVAGSPTASSNPVATHNPGTGNHHIVYRSADGRLHVLYSAGGSDPVHYEGPLSVEPPLAAGDPSIYFTPAGDNVVVFRATDGTIHSYYWSTGEIGHDALSEVAGMPPTAVDPAAYYIASLDLHQITYRSHDGHLYELYARSIDAIAGWDLTAAAGAPQAVGDPIAFYTAGTNTKHVVYLGPFSHLYEISWAPGLTPMFVDLTLAGLAPRAVDRPAAFGIDGPHSRYVVYRGFDDQVHEITWTEQPWRTAARIGEWRWCGACQGLFYGPYVTTSRCPAGGTHTPPETTGSTNFQLPVNVPTAAGTQSEWRWCGACQGLFYGPNVTTSRCPAGGTHTPPETIGSSNYGLPRDLTGDAVLQEQWRWCGACQGLFYGPNVTTSRSQPA